jgi:formylglycine-generating enzyme required for sulfatase activity
LILRPSLDEIIAYRRQVDAALQEMLNGDIIQAQADLIVLGCQHEQQHQELLLTDLKYVFAQQSIPMALPIPLCEDAVAPLSESVVADAGDNTVAWQRWAGGLHAIGWDGQGFAYDNEGPRHQVMVPSFEIASRAVSCGDWLAFINDGGYQQPLIWLDDGWAAC